MANKNLDSTSSSYNFNEKKIKINHLEKIREDIRDEIKRRIEQRDRYSIEFTIALSAIIAVSFYQAQNKFILIFLPGISNYFSWLIFYSYRIHIILVQYIYTKIEPSLSELCKLELENEWQHYYKMHEEYGIRRPFFLIINWLITFIILFYLILTEDLSNEIYRLLICASFVIYPLSALIITLKYKTTDMDNVDNKRLVS